MLLIQQQLNTAARTQLMTADARRVSVNTEPRTVFQIDSYVLALNPKGTETRVHCQWLGPFRVIRFDKSEYTIQNLITKKIREVHASQLKILKFNPTQEQLVVTTWNFSLKQLFHISEIKMLHPQ